MSDTKTILSTEEIISFIRKGIENAKGSPDAIELLTETDCLKLGEGLADREALLKTPFFSVMVNPINNIEEGKTTGNYDSSYNWITANNVLLEKAEGSKRIYFIPVTENVEEGKEAEFLAKYGKKPVTNAPNYLLGAMAKLKESDLPEGLKLKDLVAVADGVFLYHDGNRCSLYCRRRSGERKLNVVFLNGEWSADRDWVFLAEEL